MRRLPIVAAVLALPLVVTACGKSSSTPSSLKSPSAEATSSAPSATPVTGDDKTRAAAIQLTVADLPDGWKSQKITTTKAKERQEDADFDACLGVPTVEDVETTSNEVEFDRSDGFAFLSGLINVTKTEDQAQAYQAALTGPKMIDCSVASERKYFPPPAGSKVVSITGSKLDVPAPGIGVRTVLTLQLKNGRKVTITSDVYGVVVKRFVVQLNFTGLIQPMQKALEVDVSTKVFTRALANAS